MAGARDQRTYRRYANQREWTPAETRRHHGRPEVGMVIGASHAVWRVMKVSDSPFRPNESAEGHYRTPYLVEVEFIGGALPPKFGDKRTGYKRVAPSEYRSWHVYPGDRWPMCSCCGEPMPCQSTIQDDQVGAALDRVEKFESRAPGSCWACGEAISSRQRSIAYDGDNLDFPGGISATFHLRADCRGAARSYEARWLEADASRRRRLTYPQCGGHLVSHADGEHECVGDQRDLECLGAISHDHRAQSGCRWAYDGACTRGCPPTDSYIRRSKRPLLRDSSLPQGTPSRTSAIADSRQGCPGHLLIHQDGTSDCIAGGRDDCWGGDKFRHETEWDCRSQSHGCPKCEVAA